MRRAILAAALMPSTIATALLMSDLPTPSLVFDMKALQIYTDGTTGINSSPIPPNYWYKFITDTAFGTTE